MPFDAPRQELVDAVLHLQSDREALGLPGASLLLLRGALRAAVADCAAAMGIAAVLIDGRLRGVCGSARVLHPEDVPVAEGPPTVRLTG